MAIANAEQLVHKRYQGRHLLIVDDVPVNLEVPQLFLEDSGLLVDTAEDGVLGYPQGTGNALRSYLDGRAERH